MADRVALSWKRCVDEYGLDPTELRKPEQVNAAELADRQTLLADLLTFARPEMASLSEQIDRSGYAIVLADSDGVALDCCAEPSLAANSGLVPGAVWTERGQGTNALGTCLAVRKPIVIHRGEHFLTRNIGLTCSAVPIFDHHGAVIAVLDASGESQATKRHTLVLVNTAAQRIENQLFLHRFNGEFILRFHNRAEFLGTLGEGTIAFSATGNVLAANRSALYQLGHASPQDVIDRDIGDLFNESAQVLVDLSRAAACGRHPSSRHGAADAFWPPSNCPREGARSCCPGHQPVPPGARQRRWPRRRLRSMRSIPGIR